MAERSLVDRMKGAALLDAATYEDVEHDAGATAQAALVVTLVALASAVGSSSAGSVGAIGTAVGAILGWFVWAGVTWVVGDKLFGGTASWGELLRTLGFAQSPGVLAVLAVIPLLGWLVSVVLLFWVFMAGVIAVRQALDFGTGKAAATVFVGWLGMALLRLVFRV